jgi:hypothetical protein
VNAGLRSRLALDGTPAETPVLTHRPARDGTGAAAPADGPPAAGRVRRKALGAA